jgi:flagellin-like hook-associated protein FlgL
LSELTTKFIENTSNDLMVDDGPGPKPSFDFGAPHTINDLVSFLNSTGGQTSASYDATTGQLSITVAAGVELQDRAKGLRDLGMTPTQILGGRDVYDGPGTFTTILAATPPPPPAPTPEAVMLDVSTATSAAAALTTIKSALAQLAQDRATVGASVARLVAATEQLGTLKQNLAAASSRIKDVNVAEESANFARYRFLVQAGTAMVSQANSSPAPLLRLLTL